MTGSAGLAIPRNWHDTYHSAVGLEYDVSSRWSVQGGVAYDTSPTNRNDRTADMPLDEQIRFAFGAEYRRANGMIIASSIVYADYGDARINSNRNPPFDGIVGEYDDNNIVFLTVSVNWQRGEKRH